MSLYKNIRLLFRLSVNGAILTIIIREETRAHVRRRLEPDVSLLSTSHIAMNKRAVEKNTVDTSEFQFVSTYVCGSIREGL